MSNFTVSHAPDHDLQKMLQCQIPALFCWKPPQILVGLVANRQEVLSTMTIIFSLTFTIPSGVPPLDISHQPLHACLARPQTELQAPVTHYWWGCTSPTTHAVQAISIYGWSKICSDVRASGDICFVVPTNVKLKVISPKILIFNAEISTTIVALNLAKH